MELLILQKSLQKYFMCEFPATYTCKFGISCLFRIWECFLNDGFLNIHIPFRTLLWNIFWACMALVDEEHFLSGHCKFYNQGLFTLSGHLVFLQPLLKSKQPWRVSTRAAFVERSKDKYGLCWNQIALGLNSDCTTYPKSDCLGLNPGSTDQWSYDFRLVTLTFCISGIQLASTSWDHCADQIGLLRMPVTS